MQGQGLYKGSKNAPEITQVMTEEISHLLKRPRSAGLFSYYTVPTLKRPKMVSRARIFLNGLSPVHFRFESSTCCICCCYCFWSAPRRDCLKSAITMCLVRFSVCQLIGYWCCYCYLPIQRKKSVFFSPQNNTSVKCVS